MTEMEYQSIWDEIHALQRGFNVVQSRLNDHIGISKSAADWRAMVERILDRWLVSNDLITVMDMARDMLMKYPKGKE